MEGTLKAILDESIHQSKILKELLVSQTSNPNDKKKGEKDESSSKSQTQKPEDVGGGPSNPNTEATVKPHNRKRMSTQTRRHEERKRQKLSAEERRKEREAAMILDKKEQEKTLADLKKNTQKIVEVVQARNLKEVIDKSKQTVSTKTTEEQRRGRDEGTLKLIEQIRREYEEEEKFKTDVKQEPFTEEEMVITSCGVPGFNLEINKFIAIKAIGGTKRLSGRLSFDMEDGSKQSGQCKQS